MLGFIVACHIWRGVFSREAVSKDVPKSEVSVSLVVYFFRALEHHQS